MGYISICDMCYIYLYTYIYIMYLWSLDGYIALNSLIIVASAATHKMEKGKSQHVDGSIAKWLAKGLEGVPTHDTGWSRIQPSKPSGASWPAEPYPMSTQRLGTASCIRGMPWPQRLARLVPKMPAYIYIYIYGQWDLQWFATCNADQYLSRTHAKFFEIGDFHFHEIHGVFTVIAHFFTVNSLYFTVVISAESCSHG